MNTETEALTYDHIVALALEHGFKLKPQVDGRMALNDYVIDFARAVYAIGHADAKAGTPEQEQAKQRDAERWRLFRELSTLPLDDDHPLNILAERLAQREEISADDVDAAIDAAMGGSNA